MGQQMGETESVTAGLSPNVPGVSPIKANKDRPQSIQSIQTKILSVKLHRQDLFYLERLKP
jgi:hypothetical protein